MSFDPNDPRLTSYALDELEGAERDQFEAELAASPEGQKAVAEIRALATRLESELAGYAELALTPEQRAQIAVASMVKVGFEPAISTTSISKSKRRRRLYLIGALVATAAAIVVIAISLPGVHSARDASPLALRVFEEAQIEGDTRSLSKSRQSRRANRQSTVIRENELAGTTVQTAIAAVPQSAATQDINVRYGLQAQQPAAGSHFELRNQPEAVGGHPSPQVKTLNNLPYVNRLFADSDGDDVRAYGLRPIDEWRFESPEQGHNTEAYDHIVENPFLAPVDYPLSTFSIDVDTASYANVRRFLQSGQFPPAGAVRIEELVNYFRYDYSPPEDDTPFSAATEVAACPWAPEHRLVRVALKGREIKLDQRPASNLVFLLDVSGSMQPYNKLPLVKQGLRLLVEQLNENDRVAMVVYAGASGLVLESTPGDQHETILAALDRLEAGGSTNGGAGIELAYEIARQNFIDGGTNRVILCTDGDFNVGTTDQGSLVNLIEEKAKSGVFLSVLGFGMGNYKDSTLEKLADKGNGNYGYVDNEREARKLFVEQMTGTLITIAKDVKIQIEFNPAQVGAYRLIGYENRLLAKEDFNDDTKDAGEIGAGHTVTALYEIVPAGEPVPTTETDELKYQRPAEATDAARETDELLTLKLRYKEPDGETSKLLVFTVADSEKGFADATGDYQFAAAVAGFGLLLRDSQFKGNLTYEAVKELATPGLATDAEGYRREFVNLVEAAARSAQGPVEKDQPQQ